MLDFSHIPTQYGSADVQTFVGMGSAAGECWQVWQKPRGKSMIDILLVGKGGNGGAGAIGANSTAAGGGGGGSGGQTRLTMPLHMLPDQLYLSLAGLSATTTLASYVAVSPKMTAGAGAPAANDTLMIANGGGNGGNAAGATAGAAGAAGSVGAAGSMPLGWAYATAIPGQAGIIGGVAVAGGNISAPVTGLFITGGAAGGGLPAAAAAGSAGGRVAGGGIFTFHYRSPAGGSVATTPPESGFNGYYPVPNMRYGCGGAGGGSTHGSATGVGLVQASGGGGAPGCGGGGSGGALTGSTAGVVGMGGPAFAIITCW